MIIFLYCSITIAFLVGWLKTSEYVPKVFNNKFTTFVSVVIAVRNEENCIADLLTTIVNQTYLANKTEIIVVDDHSDDKTLEILKNFRYTHQNIKIIRLADLTLEAYGKKVALELGISVAKGKLIVSTDADCVVPKDWLLTLVSYYEEYAPKMIIAPVKIEFDNNIFTKMQALEFMSLIGVGAGAALIGRPIMCNGANIAYEKDVFDEFSNAFNKKYVSGDDVLLMLSIKQKYSSESIHVLKSRNAIVTTKSQKSLKKFVEQRKRWTSKSKAYKDFDTIFTAIVVLLTSLSILVLLCLIIPYTIFFNLFLFVIIAKSAIDFPFISILDKYFYKQKKASFISSLSIIPIFMLLQIIYPIYVVYIGIIGNLSNFEWKTRKY